MKRLQVTFSVKYAVEVKSAPGGAHRACSRKQTVYVLAHRDRDQSVSIFQHAIARVRLCRVFAAWYNEEAQTAKKFYFKSFNLTN